MKLLLLPFVQDREEQFSKNMLTLLTCSPQPHGSFNSFSRLNKVCAMISPVTVIHAYTHESSTMSPGNVNASISKLVSGSASFLQMNSLLTFSTGNPSDFISIGF